MANLLANIITLLPTDFGNSLNWLGTAIQWVVGLVSSVGVGIILFTLVLKLITLPLDIYSKAKMRKNNLKMEKMRPQLEKLQKQYQNDQRTYNQKMMELYKKNGYSMFGACLPMIVTLVIFMVVLGAFSTYSQYTNVDLYRQMSVAYNESVVAFAPEDYRADPQKPTASEVTEAQTEGRWQYTLVETYDDEDSFLSVRVQKTFLSDTQIDKNTVDWSAEGVLVTEEFTVKTDTIYANADRVVTTEDGQDVTVQQLIDRFSEENGNDRDDATAMVVMRQIGRNAAENAYNEHRMGFLWVKNIWLPDTSYTHPVQYETEINNQDLYDEITYNLNEEKNTANGYYILIIISIGTMFLSQFILAKSQKAQNDLQTANGQGAKTQKVMMIIMPIIFGVFSFMYSAAFSIYMVVSNIFGIVSTLLINFFIDRKFKKIEEQEIQEKYNKRIPQANRAADGKSGGKKK